MPETRGRPWAGLPLREGLKPVGCVSLETHGDAARGFPPARVEDLWSRVRRQVDRAGRAGVPWQVMGDLDIV